MQFGMKKVNPHESKLSKEEKENKILTNAILTVDKYAIKTPAEYFTHQKAMIFLVTLFDIRNDKKMIDVEKMDENGNKKTVSLTKNKVMKLIALYIKKKIPSEDAFWVEDLLLKYAQEIITLHDEAVKDIPQGDVKND